MKQLMALGFSLLLLGCATTLPNDAEAPTADGASSSAFAVALKAQQQGDRAAARDGYLALVKAQPGLQPAWYNLGLVALAGNDLTLAAEACDGAIKAAATASSYHLCGRVARASGDLKAAAEAYAAGLKLAPDDAELHLDAGVLAEIYLGQPQQALAHYQAHVAAGGSRSDEAKQWIELLQASAAPAASEEAQ